MVVSTRSHDNQQGGNQGQGSNPSEGANPPPEGDPQQRANPAPANEQMLSQILAAIQGLAQSTAAAQNAMLEVVQRIPIPAVQGGNGAASSADGSGSAPPRAQEGSQGARNGPPPVALAEQNPASQAPRVVEDLDKFNKEKFIKNGAKEFVGGVDPIKAENWINNMETTFRAFQVPHRHKTRLATTMLQEEAYHWWQSMEKTTYNRREINSITWSEFVNSFNQQYFPELVIQQKALEFNNLTQGNDSVREYARKFLQLERFSPGSIENEKARCSKYFWGLKFELRDRIANIARNSLTEIINAAANHELILEQDKVAKKNNPTPKSSIPTPVVEAPKQQGVENASNPNKRKRDGEKKPWKCRNCGKEHFGKCFEQPKCFNCGKTGHMKKDCPEPAKDEEGMIKYPA